jgi:transcription termination factor Rho
LPTIEVDGVLELSKKGHGFLRSSKRDLLPQTTDPFVPINLIQRYNLREGLLLTCQAYPGPHGQAPRIIRLDAIDGIPAADFKPRAFESLTPVDPTETIRLETGAEPLTMRVMDLLTPIGKGQRGLIVAPPRTGKTILLQHIAKAISENHPDYPEFSGYGWHSEGRVTCQLWNGSVGKS